MCGPTDGKRPEKANPQTQRVGSWLPGAEEGVGLLLGSRNVLKLVVMVAQNCEYTKIY